MRKELEQLEIIRIDEVKNLEEIEMEIVILKGKLIIERKKNDLEEYEMEQLEVEVKAETELLKKDKKKWKKRKKNTIRLKRARNKRNRRNIN